MIKSKREFVKKTGSALALSTTGFSFNIISKDTVADQEIIGHGDFQYKVHKDWGTQNPNKVPVQDCHEMVQTEDGRLFLLTNETKNNIIIYDRSGKVLSVWGHAFPGAHGLTLSREGDQEFLFITDLLTHEVYKTTLDGQVIMTIPYPQETGLYRLKKQFMPTEVAVAPNGDFFITDGYGLQYVIKYDSKGNILKVFGGLGSGDDLFASRWTAHGVCIDKRNNADKPTLIVSARHENLFKWFDLDGNFLRQIYLPGAFLSRPVIHENELYTAVLNSEMPWAVSNTGFVMILNKENKVISNPGGTAPVYRDNKLQTLKQKESIFMHPHDVCIDDDLNIYVCQWNSSKTYPIKLERI